MATIRQLLEDQPPVVENGRSGLFGDGELRRWKAIDGAAAIFCHGEQRWRARAEATIFGHGGNSAILANNE